ncbi:hypothetical protein RMSM_05942 [Rhodopirellula maiorica SM1]|uniref:Uncharacterized protein n=1 Tax=Rhodopirellula maiorica SM1 TaxID=1265738 RepID=M5RT37_9BACT|nr:hypothetical protein RMSM_05942 [Rhodopirellula maiorica SM1]
MQHLDVGKTMTAHTASSVPAVKSGSIYSTPAPPAFAPTQIDFQRP